LTLHVKVRSEEDRDCAPSWIVDVLRGFELPPEIKHVGHLPKYPNRLYIVASGKEWFAQLRRYISRLGSKGSLSNLGGIDRAGGESNRRSSAPIEPAPSFPPTSPASSAHAPLDGSASLAARDGLGTRASLSAYFGKFLTQPEVSRQDDEDSLEYLFSAPPNTAGSYDPEAPGMEISVGKPHIARGAQAARVLQLMDGRALTKKAYCMSAPVPCWVRILDGLYKGDLGLLAWHSEANGRGSSYVLVVPRLRTAAQGGQPRPHRVDGGSVDTRPPRAHFSCDIEQTGPTSTHPQSGHIVMHTVDGDAIASSSNKLTGPWEFACLEFRHDGHFADRLATTKPSASEVFVYDPKRLVSFFAGDLARASRFEELMRHSSWVPAIGTPVRLLAGELKGAFGRVCGRRDDSSSAAVRLMDGGVAMSHVIWMAMDDLDLDVKFGDNVRFPDAYGVEKKGIVIDITQEAVSDPSRGTLARATIFTAATEEPVSAV
jgi:hypothetical protein